MQSSAAIHGALTSPELVKVLQLIRAGTAVALDISAANISLSDKAVLSAVVGNTATREMIMQSALDPSVKELIMHSPYMALTGNRGTGAVGTVV